MRWLPLVLLAACASTPPRATDVLAQMTATYAHARSYTDYGASTTVFYDASPRVANATFETAFVRANGFSFLRRNEFGVGAVWTDDRGTHQRVNHGPAESRHSTSVVESRAPDLLSGRPIELSDLELLGTASIDDHSCWWIRGTSRRDLIELWIDRTTHVLRQTRTRRYFPAGVESAAFSTVETTHYDASLDTPISAARLRDPDHAAVRPHDALPWVGVGLDHTRITRVLADSPAATAGVQVGDRLLAIDGLLVADPDALVARVRAKRIGDVITLLVMRGAAPLQLAIVVGDALEWEQRFAIPNQILSPRPELAGHATVLVIAPSDYNDGCDACEPAWKYLNKLDAAYARSGIRVVQVTDDAPPAGATYTFARDDGLSDTLHVFRPTILLVDRDREVRWRDCNLSGLEMLIDEILR
jgi:hypothetical protein